MLESQIVIKQGIHCRVDNGQCIDIVEEPWLPLENEAYIQTSSAILHVQMVSFLMNVDNNS